MHVHLADATDPLIRLVRLALSGVRSDSDREWVDAYFAPEPSDHVSTLESAAARTWNRDWASVTWSARGSEEELIAGCADADVLVLRRANVTPRVLKAATRLRRVIQLGEAAGCVDATEAHNRGIEFRQLPRPSLDRTAEHVLLLMLALARRLIVADALVRSGDYSTQRVRQQDNVAYNWGGLDRLVGLHGRKLGIVGLGAVGRRVVPLARAFGMDVSYSSRSMVSRDPDFDHRHSIVLEPLDVLLATSDFVSLHAHHRPGTPPVMGAAEFMMMKRKSYFINTSRGQLVDEQALIDALISGCLAGAALDVHAVEPRPASDVLCELENVILTPHIAGCSRLDLVQEIGVLLDVLSHAPRA